MYVVKYIYISLLGVRVVSVWGVEWLGFLVASVIMISDMQGGGLKGKIIMKF